MVLGIDAYEESLLLRFRAGAPMQALDVKNLQGVIDLASSIRARQMHYPPETLALNGRMAVF